MDIPGFVHLLRDWVVAPGQADTLRETARRAVRDAPHFLCATCPGPQRRPGACVARCAFGESGPAAGGAVPAG